MMRTRRMIAQLATCFLVVGASGLMVGATAASASTPTKSTTTSTTTSTPAKKATASKSTTTSTAATKTSTSKSTTSVKKTTSATTPTTTAKRTTTATAAGKKTIVAKLTKTAGRTTATTKTPIARTLPTTTTAAVAPPASTAPIVPDAAAALAQNALGALRSGKGYEAALAQLASGVSGRLGVSSSTLLATWKASSKDGMTVVLSAMTQLGVPYTFNAATPQVGFDCSGLASWAWAQAGVSLPHQSLMMIDQVSPATLSGIKPGDLLYYPGHVMISLGVGDTMVEAAGGSRGVVVSALKGRHAVDLQVGDPTPAT